MFETFRDVPLARGTAIAAATGLILLGVSGCHETCKSYGKARVCKVHDSMSTPEGIASTTPEDPVIRPDTRPEGAAWIGRALEIAEIIQEQQSTPAIAPTFQNPVEG